jgi:hypothetical protein
LAVSLLPVAPLSEVSLIKFSVIFPPLDLIKTVIF